MHGRELNALGVLSHLLETPRGGQGPLLTPFTDKMLEVTVMFLSLSQVQWQESGGQGFKPGHIAGWGESWKERPPHPLGRGSRATHRR